MGVKQERPVLILVHGAPGAGKTTLARRLAYDTGLPMMGKDALKEFFFDSLGIRDREWSRTIGGAVSQMLYTLTNEVMLSGQHFILESAFYATFANDELLKIVQTTNARCLQIYCQVDHEERKRRFIARNESGERHPGHVDASYYADFDAKENQHIYLPLNVGELYTVDTTDFGDSEYSKVLRDVGAFIDGKSNTKRG